MVPVNVTKVTPPSTTPLNQPPIIDSLIPDTPSPQVAGATITWTAEAKDPDNDQILYRFFLNNAPMTDWTTDGTWTWTTSEKDVGSDRIELQVRDGKHAGPNGLDDRRSESFNIIAPEPKPTVPDNQPPVIASMVSDKSSPQDAGTSITWTVKASDPENGSLLYRFLLRGKTVSEWSSANSWTWTTTSEDIGENQIEVQVRDGKHALINGFDDRKTSNFDIIKAEPDAQSSVVGRWWVQFYGNGENCTCSGSRDHNIPIFPSTWIFNSDGTLSVLNSDGTLATSDQGENVTRIWSQIGNNIYIKLEIKSELAYEHNVYAGTVQTNCMSGVVTATTTTDNGSGSVTECWSAIRVNSGP